MTAPDEPGSPAPFKDISAVIEALIVASPNPAVFRELYYWSREPDLLPAIRAIAVLSDATRNALELFVRNAPDALAVVAQSESDGCLRLEYRHIKRNGE